MSPEPTGVHGLLKQRKLFTHKFYIRIAFQRDQTVRRQGFTIDRRETMEFKERKRWLFFGLPFTFTVYTVKEDVITVNTGFLNREENDCYMYKVQDVTLRSSLVERMFGLGTIVCHTGDVTSPILMIEHIKNAREVKQFILEKSEEDRRRRRTLNTLDIGAVEVDDVE